MTITASPALLNLIIWLPAGGAILIALIGAGQAAARLLALVFSLVTFVVSLVLFASYQAQAAGYQAITELPWIGTIGSSYWVGVDGISLPLIVLNALLSFLAVVISWNVALRPQLYFALLMVLETAVMGVFSSLDLLLFFLFWELELAPMYLLIGIWGNKPRCEYAAMKFIIYTITGSAFMLIGILALYFGTGAQTFGLLPIAERVPQIAQAFGPGAQLLIFVLLFIGFAVKVPIWPLHTWLPDAHGEAPTAGSVLLAGVLLKMGAYGLLRFNFGLLPEAGRQFAGLLVVLAVINIIYGALVAMVQPDLKRMIANSSVSHMGYVLLGLAAMNQIGIQGAVVQMVTHGTITGLLFMMVGVVYDRTHTRQIPDMKGLANQMPVTATLFTLAALASLGLPLMSGFIAEFLVFLGAYPVWPLQTVLGVSAIVVTAGYLLWMLKRIFAGPLMARWAGLSDASPREVFAAGTLVFFILLIGCFPNVVVNMISVSVEPVAGLFRVAAG